MKPTIREAPQDAIVSLCSEIDGQLPSTRISISEITSRTDCKNLNSKAQEVNKLLYSACQSRNWPIIMHKLDDSCLNSRGLHPNKSGLSHLATNFNSYIRSISCQWPVIKESGSLHSISCGSDKIAVTNQNSLSLPKIRGFKMAHLNIVSLPKHVDQLRIW